MTTETIEAERLWLIAHKEETGMTWPQLYQATGLSSALSAWVGNTYTGNCERLAEGVIAYRERMAKIAEIDLTAAEPPAFFETPTTRRIKAVLQIAQRGRMVLIGGAPGTSKSEAIMDYRASDPNCVWIVTMSPTSSGVNTMLQALLKALGEKDLGGTPFKLRGLVQTRIANTSGLIIFDEAQFLSEKALEEIRAIFDYCKGIGGIGIALVGNDDVMLRLEQSARVDAFARIKSRIAQQFLIRKPSEADTLALCDAWGVTDKKQREYLCGIAGRAGGLRNCTQVLETASMLAAGKAMIIDNLVDAWTHLSARQIAA